ncbi:MAG: acetolactate decarboxylase [Clostridia bacterium]|nr:acetolactate decarboxylase [Clostridia bacterium]
MKLQNNTENADKVFQVALLQSLTQGFYDGTISVSELKRHGDTGIGTFDGVNGELILLDGKVYQALGDGSVREADENETTPFAVVTFFDRDFSAALSQINDINSLKDRLTKSVSENGKNLFYTVRIHGTFETMKVRSVLKQKKPYKSLEKALMTDQREFDYENVTGTLVGICCPDYMNGLNAPGWHFHFVSDDKAKGGHILDLSVNSAEAEFDAAQGFELYLPNASEFQSIRF